ncbi:hypothetical protein [Streptomyces sp. ISL-94]|uniref:hypothetical protein n=1 Tax=Streptomyces sp. ISL-94 TaxID=2819190 RepID=UPI002035FB63|nr:hypothetical protein [Streptomyces sp. ISL-94]
MDSSTGLQARRARLVLAAIVVAVAALLVAGGFAAATLMRNDAKGGPQAGASPSASTPVPTGGTTTDSPMTPERAQKISLRKPTGHQNGVAIGFPGSPSGGISAAVYFWEEFAWLDDEKAAQQLTAVVSKDAPGYVDKQVSEIRKMREALGLAPSGGLPADVSFTTAVHAARGRR